MGDVHSDDTFPSQTGEITVMPTMILLGTPTHAAS